MSTMTSSTVLYYSPGVDEGRHQYFLVRSTEVQAVRFTRIEGRPSSTPGIPQRGDAIVELVLRDRLIRLPHMYVHHSPDGFEWGYAGSGPAELALNLLGYFIPVKEATLGAMYQQFKFDFIAKISQEDGGEIRAEDIRAWIRFWWTAPEGR